MLFLAGMFAAGIAVSDRLPSDYEWPAAVCGVLAAAAFAFAGRWFATLFVMLAFAAAGAAVYKAERAAITPDRVREIYDSGRITTGEPVELTGTVSRNVEKAVDGSFIRVNVDSIVSGQNILAASGQVRMFTSAASAEMEAGYRELDLRPGMKVMIACTLSRDDGFRAPGVLSRKTVLDWQDIDATGTVKSPLLIEQLSPGGHALTDLIFGIRGELIERYRELFSPKVAGVMVASLLGNKHFLDAETAQIFREGGTFHILVISGLHITFIGGIAVFVVGLFTRRKGVQFVLVSIFLWSYTIAVGAEVPVVRASLMFTVLWFSFVISRTGSLANALGACGLVLLIWRPQDLFGPSFQLTFVSVAAIVLAGFPLLKTLRAIGEWSPTSSSPFPADVPEKLRRFCETLYWNKKRWEIDSARNVWSAGLFKSPYLNLNRTVQRGIAYIFEGVAISLIVQIAMLPLVVHYFHRVTPVSVPMNLWTGVLIALESFSSLIAIAAAYISEALALPFVRVTELLHWLLVAVPGTFTDNRWLSFRVPIYANAEGWLYSAYFVSASVIALFIFLWDPFAFTRRQSSPLLQRRVLALSVCVSMLIGGIIVFHPFSEPRPDGRLRVEFLDVGQGDSIFIAFPNGETMLVDGGGRASYRDEEDEPFEPDLPSVGETVVSELLWEKGYSHIDRIVATHADADHIQGLSDAARNFSIGEAWFGRIREDDADQNRLINVLGRYQVPIRTAALGSRFEIGGVSLEILNPPPGSDLWPENDVSLVIRLVYGDRVFILTGDAELLAESELIRSGFDLHADVVKVPHHGSRTSSSSEFVKRVIPQFAVIPVGSNSPFGHPHKEVVDRWRAAGAEVMTTGESGAISFSTDGKDLVFTRYVRNSAE